MYPGAWGDSYALAWNWGYPGALTITDGGPIAPSETLSGAVSEVANRVRYTLNLSEDSTLDLTVRGTGRPTDARTEALGMSPTFDPNLYVYDPQGQLLHWNDELSFADDTSGVSDAGFRSLNLPAGEYRVEVGGFADSLAGPFELTVLPARPAA
jgi:hypothetical protein